MLLDILRHGGAGKGMVAGTVLRAIDREPVRVERWSLRECRAVGGDNENENHQEADGFHDDIPG